MTITNETLLKEIHSLKKAVDLNTRDIIELKNIITLGKGAVKMLAWLGSILIIIIGWKIT